MRRRGNVTRKKACFFAVCVFVAAVTVVGCGKSTSDLSSSQDVTKTEEPTIQVVDVVNQTVDEAEQALKSAGFTNVTTDIKPSDSLDNERWIVTSQSPEAGSQITADTAIRLNCGKLCNLYIDVESEGNLFFSTYDMEIYVDDESIGTVSNGSGFTKLLEKAEGKHEFTAYKSGDHSVEGSTTIDVTGDMTFKCEISHDSSSISFKNIETSENIDGASLEVPDVTRMILSEAMSKLEAIGFSNVREEPYSNIWDRTNWVVTSQGIAAGEKVDKNTQIILNCQKKDEYLNDNYAGDDAVTASDKAAAMGYLPSYINDTQNTNMGDEYSKLSDDVKKEWKVKSSNFKSGDSSTVELRLYFTGDVAVPKVVGLSLSKAITTLQNEEFSNIEYVTTDGSSVWDTDNWEVTKQSLEAGNTVKADEKITLTVKHYETDGSKSSSESNANNKKESGQSSSNSGSSNGTKEVNRALYDSHGIKVVFTTLEYDSFWGTLRYNFEITNDSSDEILVTGDNVAINGYQLDVMGIYTTVGAGLKAKDSFTIYKSDLTNKGIDGFSSMKTWGFDLEILDMDTFKTLARGRIGNE